MYVVNNFFNWCYDNDEHYDVIMKMMMMIVLISTYDLQINGKKTNVLLVSLSGEGTKGENIPTFAKGETEFLYIFICFLTLSYYIILYFTTVH